MDNKAFHHDTTSTTKQEHPDNFSPDPSISRRANLAMFAHEQRVGMAEAMADLREKIGENTFCAPLNQGELTQGDKFKLGFLIAFPCFFFVLGIILTDMLQ